MEEVLKSEEDKVIQPVNISQTLTLVTPAVHNGCMKEVIIVAEIVTIFRATKISELQFTRVDIARQCQMSKLPATKINAHLPI